MRGEFPTNLEDQTNWFKPSRPSTRAREERARKPWRGCSSSRELYLETHSHRAPSERRERSLERERERARPRARPRARDRERARERETAGERLRDARMARSSGAAHRGRHRHPPPRPARERESCPRLRGTQPPTCHTTPTRDAARERPRTIIIPQAPHIIPQTHRTYEVGNR